jgi:hypothetical protein
MESIEKVTYESIPSATRQCGQDTEDASMTFEDVWEKVWMSFPGLPGYIHFYLYTKCRKNCMIITHVDYPYVVRGFRPGTDPSSVCRKKLWVLIPVVPSSRKKLWVLIPGGTRNNTINWTVKFSAVARDLDSTLQSHMFPTPTCTHLLMTPCWVLYFIMSC